MAHNPAPLRLLGSRRKHKTVRPATRNLISITTHETIERRCRGTCKIRCPGSQGRSDNENKNRSAVQNSDTHGATPYFYSNRATSQSDGSSNCSAGRCEKIGKTAYLSNVGCLLCDVKFGLVPANEVQNSTVENFRLLPVGRMPAVLKYDSLCCRYPGRDHPHQCRRQGRVGIRSR